MLGTTHLIIGAGVGLGLALTTHQNPTDALLLTALGALGGLLPDIDSPHSTISRKARRARILVFWVKHRGLTHSLLILGIVTFLGVLWGRQGLAIAGGYASHLVADMMTREGIPLFWPFKRRLHVLPPFFRLRTGGFPEMLIGALLWGALVFGLLKLFDIQPWALIQAARLMF